MWMGWRMYAYGPLLTSLCSLRMLNSGVENWPSFRKDQDIRKAPKYVAMEPMKKGRVNCRPMELSLLKPYSSCARMTPHSTRHRHI